MQGESRADIGRFQILAELGRGGFATVYRAYDPHLGRQIAIKILHPHLAQDPTFVSRFQTEARAMARLRHPHIVTVYEASTAEDGRTFLVMELIDGVPLSELVTREAPIPLERAVAMLKQLASAVDYLHSQGIVHRDLKPANVMIGASDDITLMDFGIVRMLNMPGNVTQPGVFVGTPSYMAPEQLGGGAAGPPVDIYALGLLAYELLTGRPLFSGRSDQVMAQKWELPGTLLQFNPALPAHVQEAILGALARDPQDRPPSAEDLVRSLSFEPEQPPTIILPAMAPPLEATPRRVGPLRPAFLVAAALVAVVGLVSAVLIHAAANGPSSIHATHDDSALSSFVGTATAGTASVGTVTAGTAPVGTTVRETGATSTMVTGTRRVPPFPCPVATDRRPAWLVAVPTLRRLQAALPAGQLSGEFDNPCTLVVVGSTLPGFMAGWQSRQVLSFASYGDLSARMAQPLGPAITVIGYDNEASSQTPPAEQKAPVEYYNRAADLAHQAGRLFLATPGTNLAGVIKGGNQANDFSAFVGLNLAGQIAAHADVYAIQAQGLDCDPQRYHDFVLAESVQARTLNPKVVLLAGLSTAVASNLCAKGVTADELSKDVDTTRNLVSGYWLNVPNGSNPQPVTGLLATLKRQSGGKNP